MIDQLSSTTGVDLLVSDTSRQLLPLEIEKLILHRVQLPSVMSQLHTLFYGLRVVARADLILKQADILIHFLIFRSQLVRLLFFK